MNTFYQGVDLVTGDEHLCENVEWGVDDINYLRIRLDKYNRVHTIISLTKKVDNNLFIIIYTLQNNLSLPIY